MTPKRYSRTSLLIRWAYLFEEHRPLQTSTCALFWRSVALSPIKFTVTAVLGVAILTGVLSSIADFVSPDWFHRSVFMEPRHQHNIATDWTPYVWLLAAIGAAVVVGWLGHISGLWTFLHGLCKPVEIEGGLVRHGACPITTCPGVSLYLEDDGAWLCPRCRGRFVPAKAADAVARGSTNQHDPTPREKASS